MQFSFVMPRPRLTEPKRKDVMVNEVARVISTGSLHALLRFHIRPINLVVFQDSYPPKGREV